MVGGHDITIVHGVIIPLSNSCKSSQMATSISQTVTKYGLQQSTNRVFMQSHDVKPVLVRSGRRNGKVTVGVTAVLDLII